MASCIRAQLPVVVLIRDLRTLLLRSMRGIMHSCNSLWLCYKGSKGKRPVQALCILHGFHTHVAAWSSWFGSKRQNKYSSGLVFREFPFGGVFA